MRPIDNMTSGESPGQALTVRKERLVSRIRQSRTSRFGRVHMASSLYFVSETSYRIKTAKLSYCGQDCSRIPQALGKMYGPRVQCLDLSFNSLVSLRGLEGFTRLEELVLDNNQLGDSLVLPYLPHLTTLSLNNNQISDLELLLDKVSHNIPSLTYLSILSNKACPNQLSDADKDDSDYQRYRYFVLHKLPALRFLDSRRVGALELSEGRARGHLMRVCRPLPATPACAARLAPPSSPPPPVAGKHRGAFGKCNYKYTGKHSEGNRFIVNSDL